MAAKVSNLLAAYEVLSQALDFLNEDQKDWWHHTAPVFIKAMNDTHYDIHAQYRQLVFFYKCVLPYLGAFPHDETSTSASQQRYKSNLSPYGLPFEFSLNLSQSVVRYSFEPIGPLAGTEQDPFNIERMWESVDKLVQFDDRIDTTWFRQLAETLTVSESEARALMAKPGFKPGGPGRGQYQFAVDMKGERQLIKSYFFTTMKSLATGIPSSQLIFDAIRQIDNTGQVETSLSRLEKYVQTRAAESNPTFISAYLGCDMLESQNARLKLYALDREVTFDRLVDLWTLGGSIEKDLYNQVPGLSVLRKLWDLLKIPTGIRSDDVQHLQLGEPPNILLPFIVNYTLLPNSPDPEPQVYLVTFGMSDMQVADALTLFFEEVGWTELARSYKKNLFAY